MNTVRSKLATIPVLALVLALVAAAPAAAQSAGSDQYGGGQDGCVAGLLVRATGTLQKPEVTSYGYGTHFIADDETGCEFALQSGEVNLDEYVGERVTVTGTTARGYPIEGGPVLLNVREVERARSGGGGPVDAATLTFEVVTEGEAPQDATFFGLYGPPDAEFPGSEFSAARINNPDSRISSVRLTDPDGDGTYTGVASSALGGRGVIATGEYKVSIARGTSGAPERSTIYGPQTITLDGDKTISASYNFAGEGGSESPDNPGNADEQYGDPGNGGDRYGDSPSGSPGGEGADSGSGDDDTGGDIEVLPDTGGAALLTLGVGILLVAGGLLARRIVR